MVHKLELQELAMTKTLSKASWLLESIIFVFQAYFVDILSAGANFNFHLSNLSKILHVAYFCPLV